MTQEKFTAATMMITFLGMQDMQVPALFQTVLSRAEASGNAKSQATS
jgi:hypothetical protein